MAIIGFIFRYLFLIMLRILGILPKCKSVTKGKSVGFFLCYRFITSVFLISSNKSAISFKGQQQLIFDQILFLHFFQPRIEEQRWYQGKMVSSNLNWPSDKETDVKKKGIIIKCRNRKKQKYKGRKDGNIKMGSVSLPRGGGAMGHLNHLAKVACFIIKILNIYTMLSCTHL